MARDRGQIYEASDWYKEALQINQVKLSTFVVFVEAALGNMSPAKSESREKINQASKNSYVVFQKQEMVRLLLLYYTVVKINLKNVGRRKVIVFLHHIFASIQHIF